MLHEQRPQQGRRHAPHRASRSALTKVFNSYGTAQNLFKEVKNGLQGEDIREGLTAVISIKHPDPSFDSQTKSKLVSSEVKTIVETTRLREARPVLRGEPADRAQDHREGDHRRQGARGRAQGARGRPQGAARLLDALRQARRLPDARPRRSRALHRRGRQRRRLRQAGARPASFRPSCRCKGKILNVERARLDKMLSSAEIGTLIAALGCGIGERAASTSRSSATTRSS